VKEPQNIAAFYSRGPHFARVLRELRKRYPEAKLTAIAPPDFPKEALVGQADRLVYTHQPAYRLQELSALFSLVTQIRKGKYDLFAVMFDSPRLRVLAALSGARQRVCYTTDGRYIPMRLSPLRQILGGVYRNIRGRILFYRIRRIVERCPVEKQDT